MTVPWCIPRSVHQLACHRLHRWTTYLWMTAPRAVTVGRAPCCPSSSQATRSAIFLLNLPRSIQLNRDRIRLTPSDPTVQRNTTACRISHHKKWRWKQPDLMVTYTHTSLRPRSMQTRATPITVGTARVETE